MKVNKCKAESRQYLSQGLHQIQTHSVYNVILFVWLHSVYGLVILVVLLLKDVGCEQLLLLAISKRLKVDGNNNVNNDYEDNNKTG